MSIPTILENSKALLVTIRVIKVLLPTDFPSKTLNISLKLGNSVWNSSKSLEGSQSVQWKQAHTFSLTEAVPMHISLLYKSGLFKETEYCSCLISSDIFSCRKGVRYTEIINNNAKVKIVWNFIIEEDRGVENYEYLKLINEVEAEREEIKYFKNKVKAKLIRLKEKSKICKEKLRNFIENFEPVVDYQVESEKNLNDALVIHEARKKINEQANAMLLMKVKIQKELEKSSNYNK